MKEQNHSQIVSRIGKINLTPLGVVGAISLLILLCSTLLFNFIPKKEYSPISAGTEYGTVLRKYELNNTQYADIEFDSGDIRVFARPSSQSMEKWAGLVENRIYSFELANIYSEEAKSYVMIINKFTPEY